MKKKILSWLICLSFITKGLTLFGCFDTYLFLNRASMVYPHQKLVLEMLGEYSINEFKNSFNDTFLADFNLYYGMLKNFSLQAGVSSSEKSRTEFKIDEYGIKGVYNLMIKNWSKTRWAVDMILMHHSGFAGKDIALEFSVPNIIYRKDFAFVIHPVFEIINPQQIENRFGGHCGVFYLVKDSGLVGIGAEYASPQSGSVWKKRLVEGELATSLFLGGKIGDIIYMQSEFAKGLANSRDFGYAITLKIIF